MAIKTGTNLANVLNSTAVADRLLGLGGNDTLNGNGGNDTLDGGTGDDRLVGGTGNDTYLVDSLDDRVIEAAGGGSDTVLASISFSLAGLGQVEHLTLTGAGDLDGTGNGLANRITGNGGANELRGAAGNDTLLGMAGEDELSGGAGVDRLDGGTHDDMLFGGAGNDSLGGGTGDDELSGGAGADTLDGGAGSDDLSGGAGNDVLKWDAADAEINGGAGVDTLVLTGGGATLDLAEASGSQVRGIEIIDLTGSGNNTLDVTAAAVKALSTTTNTLRVDGNAGDAVTSGEAWTLNGATVIGPTTYNVWTKNGATLQIESGLDGNETPVNAVPGAQETGLLENQSIAGVSIADVDFGAATALVTLSADNGKLSLGQLTGLSFTQGDGTADASMSFSGLLADVNAALAGLKLLATQAGSGVITLTSTDAAGISDADTIAVTVTPEVDLSALDGANGFRIAGKEADEESGFSVSSAGDVNGDGMADLIIGASRADPNGIYSGASYVVFGKAGGFAANLDLGALNGTNGFQISGEAAGDVSGSSVSSAGDVNGDGVADLIIGARGVEGNGTDSGASYVVFGQSGGFASNLDLSALNGTNGFRISGEAVSDLSGDSVASAGDVNGDGIADLIIGATRADPNGSVSGASYVVFGQSGGFASNLDLTALDGTNGFQISGEAAGDYSGRSVASAGDVNGDGIADLIIGADRADPNGTDSGASYVVFGHSGAYASNLNLSALNGTNGFQISGEGGGDLSGLSVSSAGDVNGDGVADLIIGARGVEGNGTDSGASYVVFGQSGGFASNLNLAGLNGTNGFQISGEAEYDRSGVSVSSAGDVNGDGMADLIIGAYSAGPNGESSGASYVVFGHSGAFASNLDLTTLDGTNGFQISGEAEYDLSGRSVSSAGDVNGDGFDDLIIGAHYADPNGSRSGASYVVFGADFTGAVTHGGTAAADILTGSSGADNMLGGAGADVISAGANADRLVGGTGNDTLNGGTGADRLEGGEGADSFVFDTAPAADQILDFTSGTDHIVLDRTIFMAFGVAGTVVAGNVQVAASGAINAGSGDAGDFLKYASDTGELYYDADGSGAGGLQLIATVRSGGIIPATFQFDPVTDIVIID